MNNDIATILMLSKNPHYKLSKEQLKILEEYRARQSFARHNPEVPKHSTQIPKHNQEIKNDE